MEAINVSVIFYFHATELWKLNDLCILTMLLIQYIISW